MILVLVVIGLPIFALAGLVVGIVALVRFKALRHRVDEVEGRQTIGPAHPISRRLRDLQERVAILEGQAPGVAAPETVAAEPEPELAPPPEESQPPEVPPVVEPPAVPRPVEMPGTTAAPAATIEAPVVAPPPPARPKAPRSRIDWERWIGVRGAAAAGGVVLALASLLFFQYSIEHGLISPTMRVVFGVIAGLVCLIGSEWLVKRDQEAAANALAGAGIVILYGATWAAQNLYGLIGTLPAFVLMVLITVVCVTLAVSRKAQFIAVLGLLGGFAAPLLVASDMDSPAALFGYILLLDLGLLWLARARGWPLLAVLSLVGTAIHQAIWVFTGMDAERAVTGIVVLAVFGIAFLFVGSGKREPSRLWRATRAGGVAIPFAFALHFAGTADLAENPWPLGLLLLVLSVGACWLERKKTRGAAVGAAGASVGVMALWFLSHQVSVGLAWQAVVLCLALAAVFNVAAELSRDHPSARRLGFAALASSIGFLALMVFATAESQVAKPWPWVLGWSVLGGLLVLHSRWSGRAWVVLAAGLAPALGLFISVENHWRDPAALEPWAWLTLVIGFGVVFQILAVMTKDKERNTWAERTAGATALVLMLTACAVASHSRAEVALFIGGLLILGLFVVLVATRLRSGLWLLAATIATAFWHTVVTYDALPRLAAYSAQESVLALLAVSVVLFTVWPALAFGAFKDSRSGWWGAALAGPLWFTALKAVFVNRFGDDAVGLLPVGLAVVALATVMWVKPRLPSDTGSRKTALVWYLAVALSLVSVAIPLQLEKEWITIGWAINGFAILALWVRLDHPGLKYFGLALLGAATVRLVANPEVLSYHLRAAPPVLNWLSYTYLVPAAALVWSHRFLRSREVDRLAGWEERLYPVKRPIGAAACGLAAVAVVFAWINLAIADVFATGQALELSFQRLPARDATTSVAWALYALVLLAIGVRSRSSSLRWLSLGMLVLTLGKVFIHDLGELEDLYRVGSLVGLALSMIMVSLIYQRFVFRSDSGEDA